MESTGKYNPSESEKKWYQYWMDKGFFNSLPDEREPYTIVIPPPNVTGVLHMGHMLNNTIQDILIRRARMRGYNACWVPGTDHASIATEAKVVNKLKEQGIDKNTLTRDTFLNHAWEWTDKHGGIILEQLKKLGASCDWNRTCFTMDEVRSQAVIDVFVDLYNKGFIYRGIRMVNWDPSAKTAVSDEEVIYKEVQSKLYYLRYQIEGSANEFVTIATTRPETILGDTAVCVNPNDDRFRHLKGKRVLVPLINRSIPIIEDDYVDMEFGTGCLKITPAHDINDYEIGMRHHLESIDILNDNGTLSDKAGLYIGLDRFVVRKTIEVDLQKSGNLVKVDEYVNKVGFSERTDVPIEPKLSTQWFLKMAELAKPALDAVANDEVEFHPKKFKNLYRHWMENVKDWCISRQLWWGHQIPVYYLTDGSFVVATTSEEALELARKQSGNADLQLTDLRQDADVLDTWASSWLWPISVFDGFRNKKEIDYYYPTNDLVTGHDIIFFWVARMIMAGYEFKQTFPFKNVYFTGMVRDKQGRKMSKQLGNSPDPLELIEKFGADGVRVGMLLCSPAGGDLAFDESLPEQGRNFANKIFNAHRLISGWQVDNTIAQPKSSVLAIEWFECKLNETVEIMDDHFSKYRISDALMTIYTVFWQEFSGWYLEAIKPAYQQPIDAKTLDSTVKYFNSLMKLLHPFMPFITEDMWQQTAKRNDGESIMIADWPVSKGFDADYLTQFEQTKEVITGIRNIRTEKNIPQKDALQLFILNADGNYNAMFDEVIVKLTNLSELTFVTSKPDNALSFVVKTTEFFIPLEETINVEQELIRMKEQLKYNEDFLISVMKKLSNEKFVNSAPVDVVNKERQKQADAEAKIQILTEGIDRLLK